MKSKWSELRVYSESMAETYHQKSLRALRDKARDGSYPMCVALHYYWERVNQLAMARGLRRGTGREAWLRWAKDAKRMYWEWSGRFMAS